MKNQPRKREPRDPRPARRRKTVRRSVIVREVERHREFQMLSADLRARIADSITRAYLDSGVEVRS